MTMQFNQDKQGGTVVLIGATGTGKSPEIKRLMTFNTPKNVLVYDPRCEYSEEKFTLFRKFKYFKEEMDKAQSSFVIVEEASGVLGSYKELDIIELMIASEHNNNILFFAFHTWLEAAPYILRNCKFIIAWDTGDDPEELKRSRRKYFPYLAEKKPVYIKNTN